MNFKSGSATWANNLAIKITNRINEIVIERGMCSLMLTGGKSAKELYTSLSTLSLCNNNLKKIHLYITDERYVPLDHADSNFSMIMSTLLSRVRCEDFGSVNPIITNGVSACVAAEEYAKMLPASLDILLLSMGIDGHIASLFPMDESIYSESPVINTHSMDHPHLRVTVTRKVIDSAKDTYVLAIGHEKMKMYLKALQSPLDIKEIPARIVLNKHWIFDRTL